MLRLLTDQKLTDQKSAFPFMVMFGTCVMFGAWSGPCLADQPSIETTGSLHIPNTGYSLAVSLIKDMPFLSQSALGGYVRTESLRNIPKNKKYLHHSVGGILESKLPFGPDPYHYFYVDGTLGVSQTRIDSIDDQQMDDPKTALALAVGGRVGYEFPVADLMGVRCGVTAQKIVLSDTVIEISMYAGLRLGIQWLGTGD
jgi:hypothetical protein